MKRGTLKPVDWVDDLPRFDRDEVLHLKNKRIARYRHLTSAHEAPSFAVVFVARTIALEEGIHSRDARGRTRKGHAGRDEADNLCRA